MKGRDNLPARGRSSTRFFSLFLGGSVRNSSKPFVEGNVMKYSRELTVPLFVMAMVISMAYAPALCAQANDTNQCSLKITLSNNAAVFSVQNPTTNGNGTFDLFFK